VFKSDRLWRFVYLLKSSLGPTGSKLRELALKTAGYVTDSSSLLQMGQRESLHEIAQAVLTNHLFIAGQHRRSALSRTFGRENAPDHYSHLPRYVISAAGARTKS
jgi:hypothetical protein